MQYLRPRIPEKEIELYLDLFDKKEAKKRILKYIEGIFDDAESQLKLFPIPVVGNNEVAVCCATCKYVNGKYCKHPQGCESDYELWEQQTDC